jgi:hypothetical protein
MLSPDDERQDRPYVVDRTYLHVDEMHGERVVPSDLFGEVRGCLEGFSSSQATRE